jgi:integrase/recombinase XerD
MHKHHSFQSALAVPIAGYIAEKRATGHAFDKGASLLNRFDAFVHSRGIQDVALTRQLAMAWTVRQQNETASTQGGRISLLRGLAMYMNRIGYAAYVIPKAMVPVNRYAYIPYIFSDQEIKAMFEVCDRYKPHEVTPNRHRMLPLLLRILYGCGLRISEALRLTSSNVDLEQGTLFIQYTKFNKERLLPMSDNLAERCRVYDQAIRMERVGNEYFFPSPYGGPYSEATVYQLFRDVLRRAGISHLGRGKGPRVHDLRHTFAVHCLKKWVLEGRDLNNALPYLSAYLGHEDLRGSQRYLRLTADLYPDVTSKIERTCAYVIPEVNWNEAD